MELLLFNKIRYIEDLGTLIQKHFFSQGHALESIQTGATKCHRTFNQCVGRGGKGRRGETSVKKKTNFFILFIQLKKKGTLKYLNFIHSA